MAKWPTDLEPEMQIGFAFGDMQKQKTAELSNYKNIGSLKGRSGGIHFLPLPTNLEDSSQHDWGMKNNFGSKVKSAIVSSMGDAIAATGNLGSMFTNTARMYADSEGYYFDPKYIYQYQGSAPRQFTYSISMIPKDASEASAIKNIIKDFKKFSSPIASMMATNSYWTLNIANKYISELANFDKKTWALTTVTTNYTGAGSALFFEDGTPKQINLTLVFQEIETIYRHDWP